MCQNTIGRESSESQQVRGVKPTTESQRRNSITAGSQSMMPVSSARPFGYSIASVRGGEGRVLQEVEVIDGDTVARIIAKEPAKQK